MNTTSCSRDHIPCVTLRPSEMASLMLPQQVSTSFSNCIYERFLESFWYISASDVSVGLETGRVATAMCITAGNELDCVQWALCK